MKLFDVKCLELARHFYPDHPGPTLNLLAEQIQTVCEDFEQCDCAAECRGPDTTSALCRVENCGLDRKPTP